MIKRHFFLVAAALLLGLMVLAVILRLAFAGDEKAGGRGGPGGGAGRAQAVSQAVATPREFTDEIRVLGVARGRRSVNITSSTSELITRVLFTDGQRVAAGTPLVELQAREEDADIIEAHSRVAQAQREYDRYRELAERGVAPRVTAENAETALEAAQAGLSAAQARRGDRQIRAPFAGVLGLSTVTAGTLISPGATVGDVEPIAQVAYQAIQILGDEGLRARGRALGLELGGAADAVFGSMGWQGGDRRVLAQALYEVMTVDLRHRLPDISAPVTVVYGWSPDESSPRSRTDSLFRGAYASLPRPATFERIEGAEHMVMIDQPTRFLAAVERFLA